MGSAGAVLGSGDPAIPLADGHRYQFATAMDDTSEALAEIGRMLQSCGYRFVAITPTTHQRVLVRGGIGSRSPHLK